MTTSLRALRIVTLLICVAACGGDSSKPTPPAPSATPAPTPAAPVSPAAPAAPTGNLRGNAEAGALLYSTYCASCHGPKGQGDGPVAASMNPRPANHSDHVYMASLSDQHLYKVISQGGAAAGKSPLMAPWGGVINDQGIRDLIAFIRALSST